MLNLLMTVKSIALVEQVMDFTRAGKEYLNEHRAILSVGKYEIPSLIWPPPNSIECLSVSGGVTHV